eukprot:TRINITY_DN50568_c0_g1_i2.p1 TRINITY_DN50568_c0_g1~~TRINITY_DN50568_c0_g1_i2.p1  ORF type:complete len:405 (+),score=83.93 TRINITY_DN50568_c0_g1_i2:37-1251(+)
MEPDGWVRGGPDGARCQCFLGRHETALAQGEHSDFSWDGQERAGRSHTVGGCAIRHETSFTGLKSMHEQAKGVGLDMRVKANPGKDWYPKSKFGMVGLIWFRAAFEHGVVDYGRQEFGDEIQRAMAGHMWKQLHECDEEAAIERFACLISSQEPRQQVEGILGELFSSPAFNSSQSVYGRCSIEAQMGYVLDRYSGYRQEPAELRVLATVLQGSEIEYSVLVSCPSDQEVEISIAETPDSHRRKDGGVVTRLVQELPIWEGLADAGDSYVWQVRSTGTSHRRVEEGGELGMYVPTVPSRRLWEGLHFAFLMPNNSHLVLEKANVKVRMVDFNCADGVCPSPQGMGERDSVVNEWIADTMGGPVHQNSCLLYTSDAADEEDSVDLGGRRIIKKKKQKKDEGDEFN